MNALVKDLEVPFTLVVDDFVKQQWSDDRQDVYHGFYDLLLWYGNPDNRIRRLRDGSGYTIESRRFCYTAVLPIIKDRFSLHIGVGTYGYYEKVKLPSDFNNSSGISPGADIRVCFDIHRSPRDLDPLDYMIFGMTPEKFTKYKKGTQVEATPYEVGLLSGAQRVLNDYHFHKKHGDLKSLAVFGKA